MPVSEYLIYEYDSMIIHKNWVWKGRIGGVGGACDAVGGGFYLYCVFTISEVVQRGRE